MAHIAFLEFEIQKIKNGVTKASSPEILKNTKKNVLKGKKKDGRNRLF